MGPHVSAIGDISPVIRGCGAFTIAMKVHEYQARGPKTITGESWTGVLSVRGSAMTQTRGGEIKCRAREIHVINNAALREILFLR